MDEATQIAFDRSLDYHNKNKNYYDKKYLPAICKNGDKVLLEIYYHPNMGKLTAAMTGLYTILKQLSETNYIIDKPNQALKKPYDTVHASKLRFYHDPEHFKLSTEVPKTKSKKCQSSKIPIRQKSSHSRVILKKSTISKFPVLQRKLQDKTLQTN